MQESLPLGEVSGVVGLTELQLRQIADVARVVDSAAGRSEVPARSFARSGTSVGDGRFAREDVAGAFSMYDCNSVCKDRLGVSHFDGAFAGVHVPEEITCFSYMCRLAGVSVRSTAVSVSQLNASQLNGLESADGFRVRLVAYGENDRRNHVELVHVATQMFKSHVVPVGASTSAHYTSSVTSMQHFFQRRSEWYKHSFYAAEPASQDDGYDQLELDRGGAGFGGAHMDTSGLTYSTARAGAASDTRTAPTFRQPPSAPASVVDDTILSGGANTNGGVVRSKRRVIGARTGPSFGPPARNYNITGATMFNNLEEVYQDMISRDYAQQIIEELFDAWHLPTEQPDTMKFAEDLLFAFMIASTASNKATYDRTFVVPVSGGAGEIEVNFQKLSDILQISHNVTRRQFSRGIANDQRDYLRRDDNTHLLSRVSNRIGCESQVAHLGFDGSTHCTGLTTREEVFAKTLEARNLFEREDVMAQDSSDRLMQGMSGGVRSIAPR